MATIIKLHDLVNLSIGTPEIGAVNFNALHSLLHAMIKYLNIQDLKVPIPEEDSALYKPTQAHLTTVNDKEDKDKAANVYYQMEQKILVLEQQLSVLNSLPTGLELIANAKLRQDGMTPVEDMWHMMQMKKRLEANEDGVSQAMALLQDLLHELSKLRDLQQEVEGQLQKVAKAKDTGNMEELKHELSQIGLTKAEKGDMENLQKEHQSLEKKVQDLEDKMKSFPSPDELNNMVQWEILHETLVRRPVISECQAEQNITVVSSEVSVISKMTLQTTSTEPCNSAPILYAQNEPEENIEAFNGLTHISLQPNTGMAQCPSVPGASTITSTDIQGDLFTLESTEAESMPSNVDLPSQRLYEDNTQAHPEEHSMILLPNANQEQVHPAGSPREDNFSPTKSRPAGAAHVSGLNSMSTLLVKNADDNYADPTLRSLSGTPNKVKSPPHSPPSSRASSTPHRYAETVEALRKIGALSEEYALLQRKADALERNKVDRTELSTLLGTTGEYFKNIPDLQEKLNSLYGEIQDLKNNREKVTDLHALERKVSRTQFDATTEQLNNMLQDLLGRVSGQEQDWQRMLENINLEMQNKLDRMELDPLKNKLEERWKEIRRQLQEKPPQYEADDAAGIRKQLIARFHCLSCDRPLDMMVPGPPALSIPNIPGLPTHRSNRRFTVYELDQIRQHNRSYRLADFSNLGYMPGARSCGGSHTTTFPHRRYMRMQGIISYSPKEQDLTGYGLKEEREILGSDGQIYHGRMDNLPAIHSKNGKSKSTKHLQLSQKSFYAKDASLLPSRPQSADLTFRSKKRY